MTADALAAYAHYFTSLAPETVDDLARLATQGVRFKDPFNDFTGRDRLIHVFKAMFAKVEAPRFNVTDTALSGRTGYLRWTMTFRSKGQLWSIEGMSEVDFDEAGLVTAHIDHWDAAEQFYEKLPLLGTLMRVIKRRMAD